MKYYKLHLIRHGLTEGNLKGLYIGSGSDLPLWNGLARSLNTIAIRVGDLVGASNIFNFVYLSLIHI